MKNDNRRRGQALLESALVTLVFLVLLIGMLDVSQVLFIHQALVERARNAVRYGVAHNFDADAIRNLVLYNRTSAPSPPPDQDQRDEPPPLPTGAFGLTPSMVSVVRHDAGDTGDRVVVTIRNYPIRFFTPLIASVVTGRPIVASLPYEGA
jgi:hypothetical protein